MFYCGMAHRHIPEPQLLPTDYTKLKNYTIRKNLMRKVRLFLRRGAGIPYPCNRLWGMLYSANGGMWRNGRRACLRSMCRKACGFKSHHPHQHNSTLEICALLQLACLQPISIFCMLIPSVIPCSFTVAGRSVAFHCSRHRFFSRSFPLSVDMGV